MALTIGETAGGVVWVARPNRALSSLQACGLQAAAIDVTLFIAAIFSTFGARPVVPFAGLEVAALCLALLHRHRHADDQERLELTADTLLITRQNAGQRETHRFSRFWAQLRAEKPPTRPQWRLFLRSQGRELEIGQQLTVTQKQVLAQTLEKKLGTPRK